MSAEMKRFMSDLKSNPEMQEKVKALYGNPDQAIEYAQSLGYQITREEAEGQGELSDADLDSVAGGWSLGCDGNTILPWPA